MWSPATITEVEKEIADQLMACTPEQRAFFDKHRIPLTPTPIYRGGVLETVFVVARVGEQVIYYEDIHDSFEFAALDTTGAIAADATGLYQLELSYVLRKLMEP